MLAKIKLAVIIINVANEQSGGDGGKVSPVPIPNTEVKLPSADGSKGLPLARVGRCRADKKSIRLDALFSLLLAAGARNWRRRRKKGYSGPYWRLWERLSGGFAWSANGRFLLNLFFSVV